jgi:hypothetical protein
MLISQYLATISAKATINKRDNTINDFYLSDNHTKASQKANKTITYLTKIKPINKEAE